VKNAFRKQRLEPPAHLGAPLREDWAPDVQRLLDEDSNRWLEYFFTPATFVFVIALVILLSMAIVLVFP
jgi:hypothetical protein